MCSRLLTGFVLILLCSAATADQSLDVSLSADTARFEYQSALGQSGFNNTRLNVGFLYTDDDDVVGFGGVQILDEVGSGSPGLKLGIGTRAYFASIEDADIGAVTLGGLLRYSPPSISRLAFTAHIFHAPKIVAFLDAEKFTAFSAAIEYDLFPQATVYVGYRKVKVHLKENVKNSKRDYVEIDASAHLGVRISF